MREVVGAAVGGGRDVFWKERGGGRYENKKIFFSVV